MRPESERPLISQATNNFVKNSFPTELYKSTIGVYGGEIATTSDGKMVYKIGKGLHNKIDVAGDAFLRRFDDHVIPDPLKLLRKHPKQFLYFAFKSEPMRRRGSRDEIVQNIERLGLTEYYGSHPQGIEIKKPEIFTKSILLGDIYEAEKINSPVLKDIDRFQALSSATSYIAKVHQEYGAAGDIVGDILFRGTEVTEDGIKVVDPLLNIPDVILTPSTRMTNMLKQRYTQDGLSPSEVSSKIQAVFSEQQKAVDVCELMISCAFSEFKLSDNPDLVKKTIETIADNYPDKEILDTARSFIKQGRHTLPGNKDGGIFKNFFTLHNTAHLGADQEHPSDVRRIISGVLDQHL